MIRLPIFLAVAVSLTGSPAVAQLLTVPEAPVRYDTDFPSADFHRGRRDAVLYGLPADAVAVVLGGVEDRASVDDPKEFVQNPDLYYLTGMLEAGSALVLVPGGATVDGRTVREILFVPPRDPELEIWLGRRFGPERAERDLGVEMALPLDRFEEVVGSLLDQGGRKAYLTHLPAAVPPDTPLARQIGVVAEGIRNGDRSLDDDALPGLLEGLREIKTQEEVALLRRAAEITAEAQREVLTSVEAGWREYEIEALIEYTFHRLGSEQPGFPSIVASGENSVLLHYESNRRPTRSGDLAVLDIGASYRGYTADVTRTIPVDGRFTEDQRAIYDIVLAAQEAGIHAARAGGSFGGVGEAASQVLARELHRVGLLRSDRDYAGLRRFFPHGTSHHVGLQVHDVGSYGVLRDGMVVTVEPGIYIAPADDVDPRWWNIGVRIEDDVLIHGDDPVVLSVGAPKDPDEIERMMREGR